MHIGVTGHQSRPKADWSWVADTVRAEMDGLKGITAAFTSLAAGSDQIFAKCALQAGFPLKAIIPFAGYDRCFTGEHLCEYQALLAMADAKILDFKESDEQSFYEAGKYIADNSSLLFAIWDEKPSEGWGGTADIVIYAKTLLRAITIINPIARTTTYIGERNYD